MSDRNISQILGQFNENWKIHFESWLDEDESRKSHINSIVKWRNSIAHGQEANTTNVTMPSVKSAFITITETVSFIEDLTKPDQIKHGHIPVTISNI
jgi:hypothetical protein